MYAEPNVPFAMYPYLIKFGLILRSILWYGRMGLILIQPLYMIGLSIFLNLSAWASVGLSLRRRTNRDGFQMTYEPDSVRQYFDAFAKREWNRLSDSIQGRVKYGIHRQFIEKVVRPEMQVLDAGCGPGRFAIDLIELGAHVTLVDLFVKVFSEWPYEESWSVLKRTTISVDSGSSIPIIAFSFSTKMT